MRTLEQVIVKVFVEFGSTITDPEARLQWQAERVVSICEDYIDTLELLRESGRTQYALLFKV